MNLCCFLVVEKWTPIVLILDHISTSYPYFPATPTTRRRKIPELEYLKLKCTNTMLRQKSCYEGNSETTTKLKTRSLFC